MWELKFSSDLPKFIQLLKINYIIKLYPHYYKHMFIIFSLIYFKNLEIWAYKKQKFLNVEEDRVEKTFGQCHTCWAWQSLNS